jgi:hypothetical protein
MSVDTLDKLIGLKLPLINPEGVKFGHKHINLISSRNSG